MSKDDARIAKELHRMANIKETISEVRKLNPELARQIEKFVKDHSYGLVFERNLPEAVRLYTKKPAVGDTVNIRPKRGCEEADENKVSWYVKKIQKDVATIERDNETKTIPVEDLVTLVSYKDTIYPGLKEIDRIERGNPDDPYHMVINAENYHAIEVMVYALAGKVDCIYLDPPYNTGAKDWKYNNNYVNLDDKYRHSKWLAFMERRLKLAAKLLNPDDSVLIVTIDEKEYLRLGMLLEQVFPEAKIQMVCTLINRHGTSRNNEFSRTNEYIYFVMFGKYEINSIDSAAYLSEGSGLHWHTLRRSTASNIRDEQHPNQFYPIYVNKATNKIEKVGDCLPMSVSILDVSQLDGCETVFPLRRDGTEMMWSVTREKFVNYLKLGYARVTKYTPNEPQKYVVQYLQEGVIKDIENGNIDILGKDEYGGVSGVYKTGKETIPSTLWTYGAHDARDYGTKILNNVIGESKFIFPKSLYAVKDSISLFVKNKPNALIIDFFAGSGTTLHAVNLLNAEDGGCRRCICVTNNEVSAQEQETFIKKRLRPGDLEWEKHGIANYATWPRTKCSIEGVDVNGKPLEDNYGCESEIYTECEDELINAETDKPVRGTLYKKVKQPFYPELANLKMSDGFKANAIFCELTYESAWNIRLDQAFDAIAPILWMLAGCKGEIIRKIGKSFLTTDYYGVLFDYGQASKFCQKVKSTPTIKTVFVVTDDQRRYSNMCKRLPGIEVHRLYESFLKTFEICGEGGLD